MFTEKTFRFLQDFIAIFATVRQEKEKFSKKRGAARFFRAAPHYFSVFFLLPVEVSSSLPQKAMICPTENSNASHRRRIDVTSHSAPFPGRSAHTDRRSENRGIPSVQSIVIPLQSAENVCSASISRSRTSRKSESAPTCEATACASYSVRLQASICSPTESNGRTASCSSFFASSMCNKKRHTRVYVRFLSPNPTSRGARLSVSARISSSILRKACAHVRVHAERSRTSTSARALASVTASAHRHASSPEACTGSRSSPFSKNAIPSLIPSQPSVHTDRYEVHPAKTVHSAAPQSARHPAPPPR